MTDKVIPSPNRPGRSFPFAGLIERAAQSDGFVVPDTEDHFATFFSDVQNGPLQAFSEDSSSTSLDVYIANGEAYASGKYIVRDNSTLITLPTNSTTTVYVGWPAKTGDTVIVGPLSDFPVDHGRIPLWTFETDGTGVTSVTDERVFDPDISPGERQVEPDHVIHRTALQDGESAEFGVPVPDSETLWVTGWGAVDQNNNSQNALSVNFIDETYTVQHATAVVWEEDPNGLYSITNNTGDWTYFRFRVINNTGSDILDPDGVIASFAWEYDSNL